MSKPAKRPVSIMFHISGALLLIAAVAGQVWQRQPAGSATRALLDAVAQHCPAAAQPIARAILADGAHAFDRWSFRRIADAIDPQPTSRCAERIQDEVEAERSFGGDEKPEEA